MKLSDLTECKKLKDVYDNLEDLRRGLSINVGKDRVTAKVTRGKGNRVILDIPKPGKADMAFVEKLKASGVRVHGADT